MCLLTFRSLAATLCVILPLVLTSILGNALMAFMGIGVKVATLPVIALGVGIGVDYGIYIYSRLESFLRQGSTLQEAYYQTLKSTGKAVIFTGVCPGDRCGDLRSLRSSSGRHGADADLHVPLEHGRGDLAAAALARFLIKPEKLRQQG